MSESEKATDVLASCQCDECNRLLGYLRGRFDVDDLHPEDVFEPLEHHAHAQLALRTSTLGQIDRLVWTEFGIFKVHPGKPRDEWIRKDRAQLWKLIQSGTKPLDYTVVNPELGIIEEETSEQASFGEVISDV